MPKSRLIVYTSLALLVLLVGCSPNVAVPSPVKTSPPATRAALSASPAPSASVLPPSSRPPTPTAKPSPLPEPTLPPGWWVGEARMPAPRGETGAALIDGLIYIPAGMTSFRYQGGQIVGMNGTAVLAIYDPQTDTWTTGAPHPFEGLNHIGVAAYDGKLYTFGGLGPDELYDYLVTVYDPATDTWTRLPDMPATRQAASAVTLGEHIYVLGGYGHPLDAALRYTPATGEWAILSEIQQARDHQAVVALDDKIYVMGGRTSGPTEGSVVDLKSVEIYDPAVDTWTDGPPMNQARAGFAAAVIDGRIYVAGGELLSAKPPGVTTTVEMLDPAVGAWQVVAEMPFPLHGVSGIGLDGKFWLLAGSDRPGNVAPFSRAVNFTP